jgi:hypothetical protein
MRYVPDLLPLLIIKAVLIGFSFKGEFALLSIHISLLGTKGKTTAYG